jgi:hypothetical protein
MATVRTAVFVVPGETIDTPGTDGLIAHKFDSIHNELKKNGWDVKVITDVYTKVAPTGSKYSTSSLKPRFLIEVVFALVKNTIEVLRSPNPLRFINQLALRKTYAGMILREKPKIIFSIGASEALVWACRDSKIPCAEIQHGMFERSDLQTYWPGGLYPDFFLTWDLRSGRIAQELGIKSWVLGHPDCHLGQPTSELGKFVCVSLGYNSAGAEDPWGCFPESLCEVVDTLIERGVPILFRLHPLMAAGVGKSKALSLWITKRFGSVRIDIPNRMPLAGSIADSFCNLTLLSATWFEFALAGLRTLMLDARAAELYGKYSQEINIWSSGQSPILSFPAVSDLFTSDQLSHFGRQNLNSFELQALGDFLQDL